MSIKVRIIRIIDRLKPSDYGPKVFCIGFNKTGTTSCGKAFELLGLRNKSFDTFIWRELYKNGHIGRVLKIASKYDSFDDLPWLKEEMIVLLDKTFPGSKFVYLERDEESWKKSIYYWTYKEKGVYPDMDRVLSEFREHKKFVFEFFKGRSKDLLVIDVSEPDAFHKLAKFLGKEAPFAHMPHENKT